MPAVRNRQSGRHAYVFIYAGRSYSETGFHSEAEALAAEDRKRNELSRPLKLHIRERELNQILETLYDAADRLDVTFPSLVPRLVRAYEALSGKRFRPSQIRWMDPDYNLKRPGEVR
jgi:hypothetical protein